MATAAAAASGSGFCRPSSALTFAFDGDSRHLPVVLLVAIFAIGVLTGVGVTWFALSSGVYLWSRNTDHEVTVKVARAAPPSRPGGLRQEHDDGDGGDFISSAIKHLWIHLDAAIRHIIRSEVEPMFSTLPGPLSTMKFSHFSLGSTPIMVENCFISSTSGTASQQSSSSDKSSLSSSNIKISADVIWDTKCDVRLSADYFSDSAIEWVCIRGRLIVVLSAMDQFPIISAIQYALVEQPHIQFGFAGLVHQIVDIEVVQNALFGIIRESLISTLVLPRRLVFKVDPSASFVDDIYKSPTEYVQVKLLSGRQVEAQVDEELLNNETNAPPQQVFCTIAVGEQQVWKSPTAQGGDSVKWENAETAYFLLCDDQQLLTVQGWSAKGWFFDRDVDLGIYRGPVRKVLLSSAVENNSDSGTVEVELLKDGARTGKIANLVVQKFPLVTSGDGIGKRAWLEIVIGSLHHTQQQQEEPLDATIEVVCGKNVFSANKVMDSAEPDFTTVSPYNSVFHVPIALTADLVSHHQYVSIAVKDSTNNNVVLGEVTIELASLVRMPNRKRKERRAIGGKGMELEYSISILGT